MVKVKKDKQGRPVSCSLEFDDQGNVRILGSRDSRPILERTEIVDAIITCLVYPEQAARMLAAEL
jgi:hypothetical protein